MEIKNLGDEIIMFAKRSKNLFPPIAKDCIYRLLVNKITWVLIGILLLPCLFGIILYNEFSDEREYLMQGDDKVYLFPDGDGELVPLHIDLRETFVEQSDLFNISFVAIILAILFSSELINEEYTQKTMQLLRTTPIHSFEILLYRYIAGVLCMFGILGIYGVFSKSMRIF